MKKLIIAAILLTATSAFAAGFLQQDASQQTKIQGFAPNGLYSAVLTVNSTEFDFSSFLAYSVYAPADCKVRIKDSTTKTNHIQEPILGGQWNTIVVNKATPFADISGCTSGVIRKM